MSNKTMRGYDLKELDVRVLERYRRDLGSRDVIICAITMAKNFMLF